MQSVNQLVIVSSTPLLGVVVSDIARQLYGDLAIASIEFEDVDGYVAPSGADRLIVFCDLSGILAQQQRQLFAVLGRGDVEQIIVFTDQSAEDLAIQSGHRPVLVMSRHDCFGSVFERWNEFVLEHSPESALNKPKAKNRGQPFQTAIQLTPSKKPLTHRQVEIMELLINGLSAKEIAREIGMSPETVRGHLKEAYLRLDAKSRAHAVSNYLQARALVGQYPAELQGD